MYSELTALANVKSYCYASNSYFPELYEVHKKTVGGWISHLVELGYIRVELILKEGSNEVEERRIYIVTESEKAPTLSIKTGGGYPSKDSHPIREKTEDNNINIILQDEYYKREYKREKYKKEKRDKKLVFNNLEEQPELFSSEEIFLRK